jgi:hypothetical protein
MPPSIAIRAALAVLLLWTSFGGSTVLAECDTEVPALTGFSFTPPAIDTTLGPQNVTCSMTLNDALSGVATTACEFNSPDGNSRQICTAVAPTSGTRQNGTWSCVVTLPRYSPSGIWAADGLATDAVGNVAFINPSSGGFPSMLTVASDSDVAAPALTAFSLQPGAVDVSAVARNVTCNMTLTDAKSGVASASCRLYAPDSGQSVTCGATTPSSGTRNNGVFSCILTIPAHADAGGWYAEVNAIDQAGNAPAFPFDPAATLVVTSAPEDVTAPSLTGFDANPKSVTVGSAQKSVVCTMGVADSATGVATATCKLNIFVFIPPDIVSQTQSCTAAAPISGTRSNGTFECTVILPRYSVEGSWASSVTLTDLAGNAAGYPQALQINVSCAAVDIETSCRFAADHQSLIWDAVAGATQYDVYRGTVASLVDTNADHLPDAGYGSCQNSRDGNLADLTFVDTDIPTAGQKGFFYLVGFRPPAGAGLGTNSFGAPRTVPSPCP